MRVGAAMLLADRKTHASQLDVHGDFFLRSSGLLFPGHQMVVAVAVKCNLQAHRAGLYDSQDGNIYFPKGLPSEPPQYILFAVEIRAVVFRSPRRMNSDDACSIRRIAPVMRLKK